MTEIIFNENEDWEKRILCSDESCIDTIGHDGKCKECGKVWGGKLPEDHGTVSSKPIMTAEQKPEKASALSARTASAKSAENRLQ